jgi:hypothetical protein
VAIAHRNKFKENANGNVGAGLAGEQIITFIGDYLVPELSI